MTLNKKTALLSGLLIGALCVLAFLGRDTISSRLHRELSRNDPQDVCSQEVMSDPQEETQEDISEDNLQTHTETSDKSHPRHWPLSDFTGLPVGDHIHKIFDTHGKKFPFVKTIKYRPQVDWISGRSAWLGDYASHYKTSKHLIARSLNGAPDYETQVLRPGDRFNVFTDAPIRFYMVVDISRCHLWLYAINTETNERTFIKNYPVGLGRIDLSRASKTLSPLGRYDLGERIGLYKPGKMGFFKSERKEMIRIIGTRWLPFERAHPGASNPARSYGIHGCPWKVDPKLGTLAEDRGTIGQYTSDGCVRLAQEDVEEIFAVVITKPTTVEFVNNFKQAKLFEETQPAPMEEK